MNKLIRSLVSVISLMASITVYASPDMPAGHSGEMQGKAQNRLYGKVVTTMDANSYTYVEIDTGTEKHWAAGPKTALKKGSMIAIDANMPFTDFESKALKKKFKTIYFVNAFVSDQPGQAASMSNPHAGVKMPAKTITLKGIKKAKDGKTVAEVLKQKKTLAGKAVRIRGKVVKYTAKVMGKNWLHIQDSSGSKKLVVTTDQDVKKGDLVLVSGVVAVNQDLGYGYTYEVIIERAKVSVE